MLEGSLNRREQIMEAVRAGGSGKQIAAVELDGRTGLCSARK